MKKPRSKDWLWALFAILCPIVTLCLYLIWKKQDERLAKLLLYASVIGFILWIIVIIPLIFVMKILWSLLGIIY